MKQLACLFLILAATGCPDVTVDPPSESESPPVVEFDPANKIIPFPNNLLLDPMTGKVNLPEQCGETETTKGLRVGVLNQLDGFGLFEAALTATFTEGIDDKDMAGLAARIVVYKRATGMTLVDPAAATPVPFLIKLTTTVRFDATCALQPTVPQLVIVPKVPLEPKSTYVVAILDGIKTVNGGTFEASGTWRLIRSEENPVTVKDGKVVDDKTPLDPADPEDHERLLGIDLLWKAHTKAMKFLSEDLPADKRKAREQILLAWEFKTQTSTDPLDPTVAGSLAAAVNTLGLQQVATRTGPVTGGPAGETGEQFLQRTLPAGTCMAIPCSAVGDVLAGGLVSKSYLSESANPVPGNCAMPSFLGCPRRGQWANPVAPAVVKPNEVVETLVVTPLGGCPPEGCPTVIFAHGLGQSKTNALVIAPQLAQAGNFATVAIDAVAHDSRAVRISNDPARGCGDVNTGNPNNLRPPPVTSPQCYDSFLSTNLGTTRDNIRQTILDYHGLIAALKACSVTPCGGFKPNMTKLYYVGQSLGGILGGMTVATAVDATTSAFKASVLNVPAVGWVDFLENTQNLRIRCFLVDGLIDAGILKGEKSSPPGNPTMGLCLTDAWKMQPGYVQFSVIGRWVLDPADPANFTSKLRTRRVLIQEVVDDGVAPNFATEIEGALLGLTPPGASADRLTSPINPTPSAAVAMNPNMSKFVRYMKLLDGGAGMPPNTFTHGSLLDPGPGAPPPNDTLLGTIRMQTDAIAYLRLNP
jgi:hypothetical protein